MILRDLQLLIPQEITIEDLKKGFTYKDAFKYGGVFHLLRDRYVVNIRVKDDKLIITID